MSTLLFYQKLHLKNFDGASKGFETILGLSAMLGTMTGVGFLIYFGIYASWSGAAILFVCGFTSAALIGGMVERLIGGLTMSMTAFVVWPICAYLLFTRVPS